MLFSCSESFNSTNLTDQNDTDVYWSDVQWSQWQPVTAAWSLPCLRPWSSRRTEARPTHSPGSPPSRARPDAERKSPSVSAPSSERRPPDGSPLLFQSCWRAVWQLRFRRKNQRQPVLWGIFTRIQKVRGNKLTYTSSERNSSPKTVNSVLYLQPSSVTC